MSLYGSPADPAGARATGSARRAAGSARSAAGAARRTAGSREGHPAAAAVRPGGLYRSANTGPAAAEPAPPPPRRRLQRRRIAVVTTVGVFAALLVGGVTYVTSVTRGDHRPGATAAHVPADGRPAVGAAPVPTGPRTVTILGAGDVLLHPAVWQQAQVDATAAGRQGFDFGPIFSGVRPDIEQAGLAVCHLETPLAPAAGPFTGYPTFNVPPQVLPAIRDAGFDTCSTASNHTLDAGAAGIQRTLSALDAAGLRHTGSARSAAEAATPDIIDVPTSNGTPVKIAQLSYAFGFNGITRPAGRLWEANLVDPVAIIAAAHAARQAGAQIVVLSLHAGTEYDHAPNADQIRWAKQLLATPDIDVILGAHAHVVQPFEKVSGKWIAYGMGNEIARHADPIDASREGVMPRFTFTEVSPGTWQVTKAEAIPSWVQITPSIRIIDLAAALGDPATTTAQRQVDQAAYDRISGYVLARGGAAGGLTVVRPAAR